MGAYSGPEVNENGLVLALDAGNQKSLNIPSQADHGYAEWYCFVGGTAIYSIINPTGGIIYENNAGTITALVTATGPQNGTITITAGRKYYGSVPINLVVEDSHNSIAPLTMVGTQFWNIPIRNNPSSYYVYSPYQAATVNFYDNTVGGLTATPTSTISLSPGQSSSITSNNLTNHWISSNVPILVTTTQNGADKTILSPMSNYVYQRYQAYYNTTNNTTPTTLNTYVTYDSTYKVMNMTIADGSGLDCTQGLGLEYLSDTYSWGNVVSDYAIVFPYTATVVTSYWNGSAWVVWDTHSNIAGSITNPPRITRDGTNGPGVEASTIAGLASNMASGATLWKWEGTAPFYIVINDNADDEFAMLGWLSATKTTPRSGNIITDLSGNGNNGTLTNGPIFTLDNSGILNFDGTDDYVDLGDLDLSPPFTLSIWFKGNSTQLSTYCGLLNKSGNGNFGAWGLYGDANSSYVRFGFYNTLNLQKEVSNSSYNDINANVWVNYVGTYDNANLRLYRNGVEIASAAETTTPVSTNDTASIGYRVSSNSYAYTGLVSNSAIYNRALSAAEVQQNFNALRGRFGI